MLASTVQFSTTNRPPPGHAPPNPTDPHPEADDDEWYEDPNGPDRRNHPHPADETSVHPRGVRSLRTQQRAYDRCTPATPVPTAPEGPAVLEAAAMLPAELVSVPPSSTAPNTRGPPQPENHHGPSTVLDHHAHVAASAP
jgi:hypothetical protein